MLLNYNKYKFNLHYLSKCRATGTKGTKIGSLWIIKCMVTKTAYWYTLTLNLSSLVVADCLCEDTTLDNIWTTECLVRIAIWVFLISVLCQSFCDTRTYTQSLSPSLLIVCIICLPIKPEWANNEGMKNGCINSHSH